MTEQSIIVSPSRHLEPCPFCGASLFAQWDRKNPKAKCPTEGCKGAQLPVLNLDVPADIAAWNTRHVPPNPCGTDSAAAAPGSFRGELDRLGKMAHTAMSQDAGDMRNSMEDLACRLLALARGTPMALDPVAAVRDEMRHALLAFTAFAAERRAELGNLSPEMEAIDVRARAALADAPVLMALPPVAWRYRPNDGLKHPAYTEREAQALAYDPSPVPLYAAPAVDPYGLFVALLMLKEAVEYTPLGIRGIMALEQARIAMAAYSGATPQVATPAGQVVAWRIHDAGLNKGYLTDNPNVAKVLIAEGGNTVLPLVYGVGALQASTAPIFLRMVQLARNQKTYAAMKLALDAALDVGHAKPSADEAQQLGPAAATTDQQSTGA